MVEDVDACKSSADETFWSSFAKRMRCSPTEAEAIIPTQDKPRFHEATVKEWTSILTDKDVTVIGSQTAVEIRRDKPERIISSRYVFWI